MRVSSLLLLLVLLMTSSARAEDEPHRTTVVRHHTAGPWIVFGAGWALAVGGIFAEILSRPMTGNSCASCPPYAPTDSARAGQITGWIGIGTGAAMVIGGLVWHVAEPTGPQISVAPIASDHVSGLMLRATF